MALEGIKPVCLVLFNGNKEGIKQTCNIEVAKSKLMPQAIGLSDGVWAVALETKICPRYAKGDQH